MNKGICVTHHLKAYFMLIDYNINKFLIDIKMQTIREHALAKFIFFYMRKLNKFDVNHIFRLFSSKKLLQMKENIERIKIQKKK
jgi:hypothetical protein